MANSGGSSGFHWGGEFPTLAREADQMGVFGWVSSVACWHAAVDEQADSVEGSFVAVFDCCAM